MNFFTYKLIISYNWLQYLLENGFFLPSLRTKLLFDKFSRVVTSAAMLENGYMGCFALAHNGPNLRWKRPQDKEEIANENSKNT